MNNIKIVYPWLAFLALPLIAASIVGFLMLPKRKRKLPKNIVSFSLHLVMSCLLALSFMDIQFLDISNDTEVIILADCSASEANNEQALQAAVQNVADEASKAGAKVGLACYARSFKEISKPGSKNLGSVNDAFTDPSFDQSATDLESALYQTSDLFKENAIKRIVLVSDGAETDNSAVNALDTLLSNNVSIDCVYTSWASGNEFAITGIDALDSVFLDKETSAKVVVTSLSEAEATVRLYKDDATDPNYPGTSVHLSRGKNVVEIPLDTSKAGEYSYKVTLTPKDPKSDTFLDNNESNFSQKVTDQYHVLLVSGSNNDQTTIKSLGLYDDKTVIKRVNPSNCPYTLDNLIQYDEFVLSDVDVGSIPRYALFVKNLNTLVKDYGKSLFTYGATYSGSSDSVIASYNDMLPVQYHSDESKALVFLIDCSGSMSGNSLNQAKRGAKNALNALDDNDYVSIISFESNTTVHCPLTPVRNKAAIYAAIEGIETGGGTEMIPGLEASYSQLKNSKLGYKHCITLSDGMPFEDEADIKREVKKMADDGIVCSFIDIAYPGGASLMKSLAQTGGGTYYYAQTANALTTIMVTSVEDDSGASKIDQDSVIVVREANDPTMENVKTPLPDLAGFNYCRLKMAATTVLSATYRQEKKDESSTDSDNVIVSNVTIPVYAYWQYGEGKVSSFTPGLTGTYTQSFIMSANGIQFLKNAEAQTHPDLCRDDILQLRYENNGFTSLVHVSAHDGDAKAEGKIEVTSPSGTKASYDLAYDGEAYSALISTPEKGTYQVAISYSHHPETNQTGSLIDLDPITKPLYFDYSKEYDVFNNTSSSDLLFKLTLKGGSVYQGEKYAYKTLNTELAFRSYNSSMVWFLLAAIVLFLIDIFIRKGEMKIPKKMAKPKESK